MKLKNFIDNISELMLYGTVDNDTNTIKKVLAYFKESLSKSEYKRIKFPLEKCLYITNKQITINHFEKKFKTLDLESELNNLKGK